MLADISIKFLLTGIVFFGVINLAALLTWVERKQSAVIQDRIGANRASIFGIRIFGLFHPLADAIKLITKEDFIPKAGNRLLHTIAPFLSMFFALAAFACIPIGNTIQIGSRIISLQIASLNIGLIYIFAILSLEVYGAILAGFSSNNNYAFLGSMRTAAQMISYEITMGAAIIGVVIIYSTMDLQEIVISQGEYIFNGLIPKWGIFVQPLAFILFLTAAIAETKRIPFDLPEGEPEIVGYFVEYSGMKYGMFFMSDLILTVLLSSLLTTFFFGGWQVPYLNENGFIFPFKVTWAISRNFVSIIQISAFFLKVVFFCWLLMMIRWTLPRFRYDQLMKLGWKILFPLSLLNVIITAILTVFLK